jgi:hypothetical protein
MNQKGNTFIFLLIGGLVVMGLGFYFKTQLSRSTSNDYKTTTSNNPTIPTPQPTSQATPDQTKTYHSKTLKISFSYPSDFQVEEKFTTISLKNNAGVVLISRNGTNFSNIESYLKDSDSKVNLKVDQENKFTAGDLDHVTRIEQFTSGSINKHKIDFIYKDYNIYSISTSSEELYDELDQIAQSFRYIP